MDDARAFLSAHASWLCAPDLQACIVGSAALAEACRREGIEPPRVADLDLAWAPGLADGERLLRERGALVATTDANRARGTLALKAGGRRIEITSFRNGSARIEDDLAARDMTVGALAWRLADGAILDPLGGLAHFRARRIVPCGDPHERVREHPIRWLRYYRRAHEWGFALDASVRKLAPDAGLLATIPREAIAQELRFSLLRCASPGRLLLELHEAGILRPLVPELATQLDGRPAGPVRHHPEVSQALHLILALEWIVARARALSDDERARVTLAVLCHDLGKNTSDERRFPAHHGHERSGLAPLRSMLASLPSLADAAARRLCEAVCALHLEVRDFDALRPGTLATLYDEWLRGADLRTDLFALAIGADVGGRLDKAAEGERVAASVREKIDWLRTRCESVDASELRTRHGADLEAFKKALHDARARAIAAG